jgi:hypothetical protein
MTSRSRAYRLVLLALFTAALTTGGPGPATADEGSPPPTYVGPAYSAAYGSPPTQGENQSKLWFHADAWWALLVDPTGRTLRVHELMPDHSWRPTAAVVNTDVGDVGDALRDGDTVHVLTRRSDASLYYVRLSYDAAAHDYYVAPAALVTTRRSSTPATIAKDGAGVLWVGYANSTNVVVTSSADGGLTWGRVVNLATGGTAATPEVGALVSFDDRVGMLWSDQTSGSFRFASHRTGEDPTVWSHEVAVTGPTTADNHVSIARVPGEAGDTLVAVVKTGDGHATGDPAAGRIEFLARAPGGTWSTVRVSEVADRLNNPVLQVDLVTRTVHVFATHDLSIVRKTASLDDFRFAPGIGQIFVNGAGRQLSDPTTAKDPADARSGVVVLASDPRSFEYRHAELALTPATPVVDPADNLPPTPPPAVRAHVVSPESVVLSWDAANDGDRWVPGGTGVPVAGYIVERNGVEVTTVTSTALEDQVRTATRASEATSIQYSVTAVDASGNRSTPATLTVELPGAEQPRALVVGAIALLGLAGLILVGHLLYRRAVDRGARLPRTAEPVFEEPRNSTPVS